MVNYYKKIDSTDLCKIYEYEMKQLNVFKEILESEYGNILRQFKIHCAVHISRWTDTTSKIPYRNYDGYTSMLQIDFLDCNGSIIELDENVFSFFENITYISYNLLRRKYRIYQTDALQELWEEVKRAIRMLEINS